MNKIKLFFVLLLFHQFVSAQELPFYKTYTWQENPSYTIEKNTNEEIIALKHSIVTEFYFEEKNSLIEYFLEHKVLWLNSDEKIEENNKIYIPYSSTSEIKVNKARVIKKNGEVVELNETKILSAQDEETGQQYKYFAFEGIEKGSFIEYYYVTKKYPQYKGKRITLQSSYPKSNVTFDLYAPENLVFEFKSYNDLPTVTKDTLTKGKLHWKLSAKKLDGLEKEATSAYNASKGLVIYKLDKNLVNNTLDISSYGSVSQNLHSYYYPDYSKKTQSLIDDFVFKIIKDPKKDEENLIRKLERFIKVNVYNSEADGDELEDLDKVLRNKVANETGMLKLYVAALRTLKIKHELVITTNRQDLKFDKDFEAQNFLTDFLFYFPKLKTYIAPLEMESRYGFPPAFLTDNYGLFIKEVILGDYKSGVGKVKYIKPIEADKTFDKMIINVGFDREDLTKNTISLDRSLNGYYAMYIQPFIYLAKKEDKEELIEGFAKSINKNIEILDKKMINDDPNLFGIKPLQVVIDFNSEAFVEKAGKKYLFNVGELIGPQMQLYQEKKRVLPVESEFNRSYYRIINIKIPQGYKVANLDDINIKNSYIKDGKEVFSFDSYYELSDNILKITADEHYRENIVEANLYEEYRKVINSAADFNKITLVLEPQ